MELEVGLLLARNVIVDEISPGRCAVSAMAPLATLGIVGNNPELQRVAMEADARLRRALDGARSRTVTTTPESRALHDWPRSTF